LYQRREELIGDYASTPGIGAAAYRWGGGGCCYCGGGD